ncbi:MAG: squalene synthase HpnC [Burkholderiales bacterium]|nr:squalene synthase HpnC [Burkholderiales bacterium]MDE2297102.1 squalene synthase HpnC [Burkholderiales bacterium]MDE2625738.1 squalene synthase HpnC [Burkholderiales bacterium]
MSIDHYENFPVASWLCPPAMRPAVSAIYAFARTADDLADEGDVAPARRLADLADYRADLQAVYAGTRTSPRWPQVFEPLRIVQIRHSLPVALLADLLGAFEQDVVKHAYADRAELLDYCRRSANPVGRLLLHLYGVTESSALNQSDAICTALQLTNFWQDLSVDTRRGRLYLPAADCARHGVAAQDLLDRRDTPNVRALVAEMVAWARERMVAGAPLVHAIAGRAGWELRLVVQGGLRVLERIDAIDCATLRVRPTLRWHDAPSMLWRALRMSPTAARSASRPA